MEYDKCLVQVDEVLGFLSEDDLAKIPKNIISAIKTHKNKDYVWEYDINKSLEEQNLSRNTIAILSYLNMEYLLNDKQKEFMVKVHESNEIKLEQEKEKKYNSNEIFKKQQKKEETPEEKSLLVINKEKWYKKIIPFIRSFFKNNYDYYKKR